MSSRFHKTDAKYYEYTERIIQNAINDERITESDARTIREFVSEKQATADQLSASRVYKIVVILVGTRRFLGVPFLDMGIDDLNNAVRRIKGASEYKQNTRSDYVRFLKRFALWLVESERVDMPEKRIRAIKVPPLDNMTKTAEMMLDDEEIRAIIDKCRNSRDKCILTMLYEGAFRVGELGNLKWGQVQFPRDRDWSVIVNVAEKTGVPRMVPLVMAKPIMIAYMNDNNVSRKPDQHVFLTSRGQPLQYAGVAKMLKVAAGDAGITKSVTPHLFRHSRITHMIRDGMGESIVKAIAWGNQGTDMLKTYSHISNETIMNAVAEKYGIKKPETREEKKLFEPTQCMSCGLVNPPGMKYCGGCMRPLTEEAAGEQTQYIADAAEIARQLSPEILAAIAAEAVKQIRGDPGT